jgi:hypothetical protein
MYRKIITNCEQGIDTEGDDGALFQGIIPAIAWTNWGKLRKTSVGLAET